MSTPNEAPSQAQLTLDYTQISTLMTELDVALMPLRESYESVLKGVPTLSELEVRRVAARRDRGAEGNGSPDILYFHFLTHQIAAQGIFRKVGDTIVVEEHSREKVRVCCRG